MKILEEMKRKIENYHLEDKNSNSIREIKMEQLAKTYSNLKNFNNNLISHNRLKENSEKIESEKYMEKEIFKLKPLTQFELKQRIINYQNRWFEKFEVKDLINFWKGKM